jgi:predicted RNase H-like nuclease (RuvC/YqgF family)
MGSRVRRQLSRLLEAFGIVTLRRYQIAIKQMHDAESRIKQLEREVAKIQVRANAQLEQHVTESRAQTKTLKAETAEIARALKVKSREFVKQSRSIDKLRKTVEHANRRRGDLDGLRQRLIVAEQELAAARNHLMIVEVKLDILEGAANVLDARTRTTAAQQPGAPV